jgi:hypothetical protein
MNKRLVQILFGILFIGFILVPAGQVFASLATAGASLDLSGLIPLGNWNWNWTSSTDTMASNSLNENGDTSDLMPGWVSSSRVTTVSNAEGQGANSAWQSLSALSNSSLDGTGWSSSSGSVVLTGSFTAPTTGWVMIIVPYSVSLDLAASSDPAASAHGKTRASISLTQNGGSASTDFIEFLSTVYSGNEYVENKSGNNYKLGVMKWFVAGATGTFRAEVSTETAMSNVVPLPGALWLFAPGLACFFGLRKRLHI